MRKLRLPEIGLIVALLVFAAPALAEVIIHEQHQTDSDYNQYDPDFQPNWMGETVVVQYDLPAAAGGDDASGLGFSITAPQIANDLPIALIDSQQRVVSESEARIAEDLANLGHAEYGFTRTASDLLLAESLAHYAVVNNQFGVTLGRGLSIAEQDSVLANDALTATGRIWAEGYLLDGLSSPGSYAHAVAESSFSATYQVQEHVEFQLEGSLAGVGDLNLSLQLTDVETGEVAFASSFAEQLERNFTLAGTLTPGQYSLSLSASTDDRETAAGSSDTNGFGQFDIRFSTYQVGFGVSENPIFAEQRGGAVSSTIAMVPEPHGLTLLLVSGTALAFGFRSRRKSS